MKRTQAFNGSQTEHASRVSHNYHKGKYILEYVNWIIVHETSCFILFSTAMNPGKKNLPQFKKDATQVDKVQRRIMKIIRLMKN